MSFSKTPTETFTNGPTLIRQFIRVISDGNTIREATEVESEHGVTSRTVQPNDQASVYLTHSQGRYPFVANGSISVGQSVYRSADGKVSSTGSSFIGIAATNVTSDGEVIDVFTAKSEGTVGGPPTLSCVSTLPVTSTDQLLVALDSENPVVDGMWCWDEPNGLWRQIGSALGRP